MGEDGVCAALTRRDKLSESERQQIVWQLSRFTGIDASLIDPKTLVVGRQQFAEQLLRDRNQVLRATTPARPQAALPSGMLATEC